MSNNHPRRIDVCIGCSNELEIVANDLCRNCYQRQYREQEAGRIKHGLSKKARKERQDRLKCIASLVAGYDKAEELGLLDDWEDEVGNLIQTLVQHLVAKQKEIIGKPLDDILDEALKDETDDEEN
jgi:hypothetical protein